MKTVGLADVLKEALQPLDLQIAVAFVYGSIAKGGATAESDVDLMIISQALSYSEIMEALDVAEASLGRPVNPSLYRPDEFQAKLNEGNSFIHRVMEQDKIFIKGSTDDIGKSLQNRSTQG